MRKKLLSVVLATSMLATMLSGCGTSNTGSNTTPTQATNAAVSATGTEGKVFNIYCWNEEFQSRIKDHYPGYVDNGNGTGKIGDVTVNWVIVPNEGNAYQNKLDETLLAQSSAAADDKVDLFLIEADYALKYVNSDFTVDLNSIGLTSADMKDQYAYTKEVVTDASGVVKGTSWQACPGVFIYRRDIAKAVFGTDEPAEVQTKVADWAAFETAAAALSEKGYKIVSGYDDTYRAFSNNVSAPWVNNGKIVIDANIMNWIDQTKSFTDAKYNNRANLWSSESAQGANSKGDVFGYFGPAWFIDFCLAGWTLDDSEKAAEAGNGTWGQWAATEGPQSYFWGGTWICGATGTDNPSLLRDIMYQMTCNPDVMVDIVKADNDFVNNQPTMEKLAADGTVTSAFLGGQNVLEKFVVGVKSINMKNISEYDQGLTEELQAAMRDYFEGSVTKEKALENFYKAAEIKYPELTH